MLPKETFLPKESFIQRFWRWKKSKEDFVLNTKNIGKMLVVVWSPIFDIPNIFFIYN